MSKVFHSFLAAFGAVAVLAWCAESAPLCASAAQIAGGAAEDPCKLLSNAEVQKIFPAAQSGEVDRKNEKYGIVYCVWKYDAGTFYIRLDQGEPGSIEDEARDLAQGFIDPLRQAAAAAVRYETVAGVGDAAVAVVEPADAAKGVLNDAAFLFVHRGNRQIVLYSNELVKRDRAAALQALVELGKAAASRL